MAHFQWGYSNENGPHVWAAHYKAAQGDHQSPINLRAAQTCYDPQLKNTPLLINYTDNTLHASITNTGGSVKVICQDDISTLTGGPLTPGHVYRPLQFHLHWGSDDHWGSEHLIEGKSKAAELHIVHWNTTMFKTAEEASNDDQQLGLCVLAVFIKVGKHNVALDPCFNELPTVNDPGKQHEVGNVHLKSLLPDNLTDYWTYGGSLTTPPCCESVTWILFHEPCEVSHNQLTALRQLHTGVCCHDQNKEEEDHMQDNFRPPIPLGKRILRSSFHIEKK